jgi:DNA invertase Pin-like site-specific DNA recombinase
VYTRKSSEEGLEQDFNSLQAQREACEAFIKSQAGEGWRLVKTQYDDGGISGGTMERPALQRLLSDIDEGRIDVVVVYKVDRLTRSLADFAKLVEIFDAHGVSFVSITQHFNTTTSIGRLTLNMLLSFAQFEREVTGERIRDKIAASKRRGMWMGGPLPLGYDVRDRKLVINETEAETVRHLFRSYLELGSVRLLEQRLCDEGIRSKLHRKADGFVRGGKPLARGALYLMLQNHLYRGEISHKGAVYPGEHPAIIDEALWDAVQKQLMEHRANSADRPKGTMPSLLAGLLYDETGNRLVPSHAVKSGKRYRYYVSARLITSSRSEAPDGMRYPAAEVESGVIERIRRFLTNGPAMFEALQSMELDVGHVQQLMRRAEEIADTLAGGGRSELAAMLRRLVSRIEVRSHQISIAILPAGLLALLRGLSAVEHPALTDFATETVVLTVPLVRRRSGRDTRLLVDRSGATQADPALVRMLVRARELKTKLLQSGEASLNETSRSAGISRSYLTRLARLAFLAPDIVCAILDGRQPAQLTAARLSRITHLPLDWSEQRKMVGLA